MRCFSPLVMSDALGAAEKRSRTARVAGVFWGASKVASRLAYPALLVGSAVLAVGPLMVRLASVGPMQSAFWRLAVAVIPLMLLVRFLPSQRITVKSGGAHGGRVLWGGVALAGVFFASDLLAWHLGIVRTSLANASLFSNMAGFLMMAWGILVLRMRPTPRQVGVMLVAVVGALCLFGASAELSMRHLAGDVLCLLSAVFYAGYLLAIGKARGTLPSLAVLAGSTIAGSVALLPVVLLSPDPLLPSTAEGWLPLIALGLGSQVLGQGLIVYALAHLPPAVSGVGLLMQPVVAGIIGWTMFNEIMGPLELFGSVLILAALVSQSLPARPARPPAE